MGDRETETRLALLRAENLRNLAGAALEPGRDVTVLLGPNGAGKTSLLEGVHLLSLGRSFRGGGVASLRRSGASILRVYGELRGSEGRVRRLALEKAPDHRVLRLDREPVQRQTTLAAALPVRVFEPHAHELVEGPPDARRRLVDWGVFHVEPRFLPVWRQYRRALRQRNRALRGDDAAGVRRWTPVLAEVGAPLGAMRATYGQRLAAALDDVMDGLAPEMAGVSAAYAPGWPVEEALAAAMDRGIGEDRRLGYTRFGPHRADLRLTVGGRSAARRLSRGQQKILALGLVLAQVRLFTTDTGRRPVVLLDDLASELDATHLARAVRVCGALDCQILVTGLDWAPAFDAWPETPRVFHVEQGRVRTMV